MMVSKFKTQPMMGFCYYCYFGLLFCRPLLPCHKIGTVQTKTEPFPMCAKAALFTDRAAFLFTIKGEMNYETDTCADRYHLDASEPLRL